MKKDLCRQGDLLFVPRDKDSTVSSWQKEKKNKNGVIREGEATGHHHMLADPLMGEVFRPDWGQPIVIVGGRCATVVHEEHGPVTLMADTEYDVHVAREWDITSGARYVAD